mmetsp:Transcript_68783/g.161738  ORF Transcript_68783/g.161738 Transcript_68783/m.161738 type:complete len:469 (+) Transcript_68783:1688-3094(+)
MQAGRQVPAGLAKAGQAVQRGAEIGHAEVVVQRAARADAAHIAAVGLDVAGVQVVDAGHIVQRLAARRGQAKLLRPLLEVHRAAVVRLRQAGHRCGKAVAVLHLGVVPGAPGADAGQREVAQPGLAGERHAAVAVVHLGLQVGIDLAVAVAGHHGRQRGGEGREARHRAARVGDQLGAGDDAGGDVVLRIDRVGRERELQRRVGLPLQLGAQALLVVAVDLVAIEHIGDIAVEATQQRIDRGTQARRDLAADAGPQAVLVAGREVRQVQIALGDGRGRLGDDVDHAGRRVLAEQRALAAAQHFDALHIQQVQRGLAGAGQHHAINHGRDRRLHAGRGGDGADAAHEQRGVLVGRAGAEVDGRHLGRQRPERVAVGLLQLLAADDADGHRHALQRLGPARGGDGDRRELHGFRRFFSLGPAGTECSQRGQREGRDRSRQRAPGLLVLLHCLLRDRGWRAGMPALTWLAW